MANISLEMVLRMLFLTFLDANTRFIEKDLTWRSYRAVEALLTLKRVELIDRNNFVTVAINENLETLVVYVVFIIETMSIYLVREA